MPWRRPTGAGFTLIELVIFLVIMGIMASVMSTIFLNVLKDPMLGRKIMQASFLTTEIMEELNEEQLQLTGSDTLNDIKTWADETPMAAFPQFNRIVTVNTSVPASECGSTPYSLCYKWTVQVTDSTTGTLYGQRSQVYAR